MRVYEERRREKEFLQSNEKGEKSSMEREREREGLREQRVGSHITQQPPLRNSGPFFRNGEEFRMTQRTAKEKRKKNRGNVRKTSLL